MAMPIMKHLDAVTRLPAWHRQMMRGGECEAYQPLGLGGFGGV